MENPTKNEALSPTTPVQNEKPASLRSSIRAGGLTLCKSDGKGGVSCGSKGGRR